MVIVTKDDVMETDSDQNKENDNNQNNNTTKTTDSPPANKRRKMTPPDTTSPVIGVDGDVDGDEATKVFISMYCDCIVLA